MTSKPIASRGARAVIAILAASGLAGEASAMSGRHIPLRDAVSKADAIFRGQVVAVEPIDGEHDVVVVKVAAVLKGDAPNGATIRVVAHSGLAFFRDRKQVLGGQRSGEKHFQEGEAGIWLATKVPDREAYAVSGHPVFFQPATAARLIELLVAGTTDAGEEMPKLLREADARVRDLLLEEVSGPQARAAALPLLLEWAGAAKDRDEEIGFNVRGLAMQQLKAAAEGGGDAPRRAMAVLDGVLAREPEKTESAWIFAQAYDAAATIARKQLGFTEEIATNVDAQAFYPLEPRYHANPEAMQAAAPRHERAMAGVKTLRAWWARAAAAGP